MTRSSQARKRLIVVGSILLGGTLPYVFIQGYIAYKFNLANTPNPVFNPYTITLVVHLIISFIFYGKVIVSATHKIAELWRQLKMGIASAMCFYVILTITVMLCSFSSLQ